VVGVSTDRVLARVRKVVGTAGLERLGPGGTRSMLRALLFDGAGVPAWHQAAACRDLGSEAFFVDSGPDANLRMQAAKRVCRGCPVRTACLADVMAWERPSRRYGVVGGLSPVERQRLHLRMREA
jgi:hypothetical protein